MRYASTALFLFTSASWLIVSAPALAEQGDDTLRMYLSKSEVVVLGEFASEPTGASLEAGVV
jgi:hypothetical protein